VGEGGGGGGAPAAPGGRAGGGVAAGGRAGGRLALWRRPACSAPATSWGEEQRRGEHGKEERERPGKYNRSKRTGEGQNGYFMCLVKKKHKQNS